MDRPVNIKDKSVVLYIEYLETQLNKFTNSPYSNSYLSLLFQIENWNKQLTDKPIDLFKDKEAKEFDRAHKFFTEQKPYFEQLDYLRKLMLPEEQKEIDKKAKENNLGIAEKLALKNG